MKKQRIGVFGGTFNPPHMGHLVVAELARASAQLTRVMFVPAYQPPHKIGREVLDARHRLAMTRLAIKGHKGFEVNDSEIRKQGISYTVDTLRSLHVAYADADLFLIIGADSLAEVHSWREPEEIRVLATMLVYRRGEIRPAQMSRAAEYVRGPIVEISSSDIRGRVARGETIRYLVPASVERYIKLHGLYRPDRKP